MRIIDKYPNLLLWAIYTFLIGLFFIRFPLNGSLIGDLDIWFYVWQANDYYQWLFDNANYTQICYPILDVYKYTDSPWGLMTLFIPLKLVLNSDIWIFYFLFVIALGLNAVSLKILMEKLGILSTIAIPLAFVFNFNNFLISNIENLNLTILFPAFVAAIFLDKGLKSGRYLFLLLSSIFIFYQQSFSIYLFVFQFFIFAFILFINREKLSVKNISIWAFSWIILSLPFFIYHNENPTYIFDNEYFNLIIKSTEYNSISILSDWFRVHYGNILYPHMLDIENPWRYGARSGFFGISTYILLIVGIIYHLKSKNSTNILFLIFLLFIALLISSGPYFSFANFEILSPIGLINKLLPKTIMFRQLFRIHILVIIFSLVIIGIYLGQLKYKNVFALLFSFVFMIENFPFKYPLSDSYKYINAPIELKEITNKLENKSKIQLLPSCLILDNEHVLKDNVNPYKMEMIYSVWENQINHHLLNGMLAQIPDIKFEDYKLTCNLTKENLNLLVKRNEIDYFIYVKGILENDISQSVLKENCTLIEENDKFKLYKMR